MSKTHKITQLKKRIAELEKKLNRRENLVVNPFNVNVYNCHVAQLVVEHKVSKEEYMRFCNQKAYQEHLERSIARAFVDSEEFKTNVTSKVLVPHEPFLPVTIRAAIMIAPCDESFLQD